MYTRKPGDDLVVCRPLRDVEAERLKASKRVIQKLKEDKQKMIELGMFNIPLTHLLTHLLTHSLTYSRINIFRGTKEIFRRAKRGQK